MNKSKSSNNKEHTQLNPDINNDPYFSNPEDLVEDAISPVLSITPMNQYIEEVKNLSIPNQLFGNFWYEGEVCILFSSTGRGKSILAVQIADSISRGKSIFNFENSLEPTRIAYLDIELYGKLVEHRYSDNFSHHYQFSENFFRLDINPSAIDENTSLADQVLIDIVRISKEHSIKIFIIDNITALITDFEKSRNAVKLMKQLYNLKKDRGLSFLVLAHTPKIDSTKEITSDHLAGSKVLMNLCDSAFAIGQSITNESVRYLKQIKARYGPIEYGTNNVIKCFIEKAADNMLKITYDCTAKEILFLSTYRDSDKQARAEMIVKLKDEKEMTFENIGKELGMSKGAANKIYHKTIKNK